MKLRVITTVGTSIITNYIDSEVQKVDGYKKISAIIDKLDKIDKKDVKEKKVNEVERVRAILNDIWIERYKKIGDRWEDIGGGGYNRDCCAEIKTLLKLYEHESQGQKLTLEIYLISTDTASGYLSAELIRDNIGKFNNNIKVAQEIKIIEGLQTKDFNRFDEFGINNLFEEIDKIIVDIKKKDKGFDNDKLIVNISGGYKALIPYMTIFSQVYKLKSIYMYEDSDSLITIPSLPIQIDWGFAEEYYPYLSDSFLLNKSEGEKDKLGYLINTGLLYGQDKGKSKRLSRTPLGWFFYNAIEKELHVAKSVMGFFFEYKLYEYYVENPYLNKYTIVEHSEDIKVDFQTKPIEIDLLLRTENKEDYILIEVKSFNQLKEGYFFNNIKWQINNRIHATKFIKGNALEYHLCLYTPNYSVYKWGLRKEQNKLFKELEDLTGRNNPNIKFKVFMIKANYNQKYDGDKGANSNPYQQLMKDKLELGTNFKEIKL